MFFFVHSLVFSQAYEENNKSVSVTYGFLNRNYLKFIDCTKSPDFERGFDSIESRGYRFEGVFALEYEYAFTDRVGFGLYTGYNKMTMRITEINRNGKYELLYSLKSISVAAKGNFHFITGDFVDMYISGGLGGNINTFHLSKKELTPPSYGTSLPVALQENNLQTNNPYFASFTVGAHIYPVPFFGLNIEAGWEKSALFILGLSVKWK